MKVNINSNIYKLDKYCDIIVDTAIAIMDKRGIHDYSNISNVLMSVYNLLLNINEFENYGLTYGSLGWKGFVSYHVYRDSYIFFDLECLDCIDKFHDLIFYDNDVEFRRYFFNTKEDKRTRLCDLYNKKTGKKYKFTFHYRNKYYGFDFISKNGNTLLYSVFR